MEEGSIEQKYVFDANREGTKKSPKILNAAENKFYTMIC